MTTIADNVARVREQIAAAARRAGREPGDVLLVAVSKTIELAQIRQAIAAGITVLGESYAQEARDKIPQITGPIRWHMIGHLQTNKVKYIIPPVDLIHSVDSFSVAQEISKRSEQHRTITEVLVQVNLAGEKTKSGVGPAEALSLVNAISLLKGVKVRGLMTMPPFFDDPEESRPFFIKLRRLRDELAPLVAGSVTLTHLSMGMSGDFETAIEEGATMVRVGTALFGLRNR